VLRSRNPYPDAVSDPQLRNLQRDWEDLGSIDPLWAILSDNTRRHGGWDLQEFMTTGQQEVAQLLARASSYGLPIRHDRALDFGCGIGRLTRALASVFEEAVGVDISASMIDHARRINSDVSNCAFVHNVKRDLSILNDASFDLVYTRIVLQHMPDRHTAAMYVQELVRVLRPGGLLVFEIPEKIPLRHRLQLRRRLYQTLRRLGVGSAPLYRRLSLHPIRMIDMPEEQAIQIVRAAGGTVLAVDAGMVNHTSMEDRTYYVSRVQGSDTASSK
jgi:ubiquinone/menaquinone biosynthesis C-methylase UbiE